MVKPENYDSFHLNKYKEIVLYYQRYSKLFDKIDDPSCFELYKPKLASQMKVSKYSKRITK